MYPLRDSLGLREEEMTWTLFVVIISYGSVTGSSMTSLPAFATKAACEAARADVEKAIPPLGIAKFGATCVSTWAVPVDGPGARP